MLRFFYITMSGSRQSYDPWKEGNTPKYKFLAFVGRIFEYFTVARLILAILPLALLPLILIFYHVKKAVFPAAERVAQDPEGVEEFNEWMLEAGKMCEEFKRAQFSPEWETEWERIRQDYESFLKNVEVRGVQGTLVNADGPTYCRSCSVYVSIEAGGATFHSQESAEGTKIYKQAQDIEEGDCVVFSGAGITPASDCSYTPFDPCDRLFGIELTDLSRCK